MNPILTFLRRLFVLVPALMGTAQAADLVWFCPNDPTLVGSSSYDSQWPNARSHVQVFKFYYQAIQQATTAQLQAKINWLKDHHIAMAVEWPALTWTTNGAGYNVEGFAAADFSQSLAQKIKSAGGTLDYIAIDEAVFYGHYYTGTHAAQWSISQVAANAAANLQQVWTIFPNCKIGSIEPVHQMPASEYLSSMTNWVADFASATGHSLSFLHDDIYWAGDWRGQIPDLQAMLASYGVDFGVIFNSGTGSGPDAYWMEQAEVHIQQYNAADVPAPDHAIFQTWSSYPTAIVPETSPVAFAYLIDYYFSAYATAAPPVTFRRFYNATLVRHMYTSSASEASYLLSNGWKEEQNCGSIYSSAAGAASAIPLYRVYNGSTKDHAFTTSISERTSLLSSGYSSEGVAGYVFDESSAAGTPLYHASSPSTKSFYTTTPSEYNALSTSTWTKYGAACTMP